MGPLSNLVATFLEHEGWPFETDTKDGYHAFGYEGNNGRWMCYAQAREEHDQITVYSICPFLIPENRRHAIAEFIARANYGMVIGNFEMDFSDGEVRYKCATDAEGVEPGVVFVRNLVRPNVVTMDRYLPGIEAVVQGAPPGQAIAQIEG